MKKTIFLLFLLSVPLAALMGQSTKGHILRPVANTMQIALQKCGNTYTYDQYTVKVNLITNWDKFEMGKIYGLRVDPEEPYQYWYVVFSKDTPLSDEDYNVTLSQDWQPIPCPQYSDLDNDGIENSQDNCPNNANANQADLDNDGIGDACDNQDNRDSDGDGVENYEDDCPNQAGSPSNNGCPGNPDLTIDENNTAISSACLNCASILANIGSDRYLLKPAGSSMFVDLRVKNNGTATSSQSNVQYYLSTNNTLGNTDIKFGPITNFNSISPGSHRDVNAVFDYGTISGIMGGTTGNRFILMVVDEDNFNPNELNENNNVTPIPIRVSNSSSSSLTFRLPSLSDIEETKGYQFSIYNFSGQKILTREVNNIQEENTIIEDLQKDGIYIIKSKNSTRKVYVGND